MNNLTRETRAIVQALVNLGRFWGTMFALDVIGGPFLLYTIARLSWTSANAVMVVLLCYIGFNIVVAYIVGPVQVAVAGLAVRRISGYHILWYLRGILGMNVVIGVLLAILKAFRYFERETRDSLSVMLCILILILAAWVIGSANKWAGRGKMLIAFLALVAVFGGFNEVYRMCKTWHRYYAWGAPIPWHEVFFSKSDLELEDVPVADGAGTQTTVVVPPGQTWKGYIVRPMGVKQVNGNWVVDDKFSGTWTIHAHCRNKLEEEVLENDIVYAKPIRPPADPTKPCHSFDPQKPCPENVERRPVSYSPSAETMAKGGMIVALRPRNPSPVPIPYTVSIVRNMDE